MFLVPLLFAAERAFEATSGSKGISDQNVTIWASFQAEGQSYDLACKLSASSCEVRGGGSRDKIGSATWVWDMRAGLVTFQGSCSRGALASFTSTWQPPAGSAAMLTSWTTGR